MTSGLQPYPEYRDSGVLWLGQIPTHWDCTSLRRLAHIQLSNVDKHTYEGEIPVRLCNYSDVYNREIITPDLSFMKATASQREIAKFTLRKGDVLITKDSESWEDIAVSGYVIDDLPNVLCGYHLAQIRSRNEMLVGEYLFRAFQAEPLAYQFRIAARGVTRYGLSSSDIASALFPVPTLPEQAAIVRLLNYADRRIRRYIRAKRRQIALLNEQKQVIIQNAVTCGLDPNVSMKDSGMKWLGRIPANWELRPAKYFYREVDKRSLTGQEELLSVSHITGVTPRSQKNITMFKAASYIGHKLCSPGDLVINTMWAWMAALGISRQTGIVSPSYAVYRPISSSDFLPGYIDYLLRIKPYVSEYICRSTGIRSSRLRLYPEKFLGILLIRPPLQEQQHIVDFIKQQTAETDLAINRADHEIELIQEYRTRLITDVVTGKFDVREAALHLPDEDDKLDELDEMLTESDEFIDDVELDSADMEGNDA